MLRHVAPIVVSDCRNPDRTLLFILCTRISISAAAETSITLSPCFYVFLIFFSFFFFLQRIDSSINVFLFSNTHTHTRKQCKCVIYLKHFIFVSHDTNSVLYGPYTDHADNLNNLNTLMSRIKRNTWRL